MFEPSQHGFVSGRSTTTNLVFFMNYTNPVLYNRGYVHVYFDLSKAFDLVDHVLLLPKLESAGVEGRLVYLTDQPSSRKVGEAYSYSYYSPSGVSQGSVFGPLFNLFANNIRSCISHFSLLHFADDTNTFRQIHSHSFCSDLQKDVNAVSRWCLINNLRLNKGKTKVATYTRKTKQMRFSYILNCDEISPVTEMRDLDAMFGSKLYFHEPVQNTATRGMKILCMNCRITKEFSCLYVFIAPSLD